MSLERVRGGFEVEVDGRRFYVDHAHAGSRLHSLIINGDQSEVSVQPLGNGSYLVASEGGDERVEVRDPLEHLDEVDSRSGGAAGTVVAYMPGRVVAVLVAEGDPVDVGEGVVVLEAMKMENEIAAEVAGTVAKIHVAEGQSVEGGDALFEITAE
ncbi:MAG: biotin/lipoyl-containing protein [Acidobacteriota bacterium]|nr:biotin/lipoyl-containing protein [Acidobacteriota bacterium]